MRSDPTLPGVRVRELIEPLGFDGGKSIVDDYLREVRPLFVKTRTHQRTVYRPGEICQWDLWETSRPVPVGPGQVRRAWVVVCRLGYSRAGAGALIFSKQAQDVLWGMGRCLWSIGAQPRVMVWDREGCVHLEVEMVGKAPAGLEVALQIPLQPLDGALACGSAGAQKYQSIRSCPQNAA